MTQIFYNCTASRPSLEGKTKEAGKFDALFPEYSIASHPRSADNLAIYKIYQKTRFSTQPEPPTEAVGG